VLVSGMSSFCLIESLFGEFVLGLFGDVGGLMFWLVGLVVSCCWGD